VQFGQNSFSLRNFASGFAIFAVFFRLSRLTAKNFAKSAKQTASHRIAGSIVSGAGWVLASRSRGWLSQDNYGGSLAVNLWKEQHMKYLKNPLVFLLALSMISSASVAVSATAASVAQDPTTQATQAGALERGYRTGYSDGYSAGSRDFADHAARDYRNSEDYNRADRAYNEAWGTVEDYRDGYQQGFETGYGAGYDRRPFESSIPGGLSRRGNGSSGGSQPFPADSEQNPSQPTSQNGSNSPQNSSNNEPGPPASNLPSGPLSLPRDTVMLVEMQSSLSSDASQRGDRFEARVIDPRDFEGAIVEGRVTRIKRPGKVKGTAEMQLSFESIRLPDGRTTSLNADVVELIDMNNRGGSGTVDAEGGVKGKDSTKSDVKKVGAGAGVGAIIGAIFGGGKGAAIGAVIGGGVGAGTVLSKRGEDVRIDRGQQMRIRTATETRIQ
jgi:hypothetical protein